MLKSAAPILASLNAEVTISFYTEKLGFRFIANWNGYVIFERDEISLHLWPTNDPEIPKNTGCFIYVTGVDKLYAEYLPKGMVHPKWKTKRNAMAHETVQRTG